MGIPTGLVNGIKFAAADFDTYRAFGDCAGGDDWRKRLEDFESNGVPLSNGAGAC